jgi:hypothetical protein
LRKKPFGENVEGLFLLPDIELRQSQLTFSLFERCVD